MYEKQIGLRVSKLREQQGLTTTALAKRVGISQAQISRLENGKQGFRSQTLAKIAHALGVKPGYFYTEEGVARENVAVYGVPGKLGEALKHPEFRDLMESVASLYLNDRDPFETVKQAIRSGMKGSTSGSSPLA